MILESISKFFLREKQAGKPKPEVKPPNLDKLPTSEQFEETREAFINERKKFYFDFLSSTLDINIMLVTDGKSEVELNKVAELIAQYEFGITLAHIKMGQELKTDAIKIVHSALEGPIYYQENLRTEEWHYFFSLKHFLGEYDFVEETKENWEVEGMALEDLMVVAGVEEASHNFYHHKENWRERLIGLMAPTYHTKDDEYSALTWKLWVVRKYFPQHHAQFKAYFNKQRALRREALERA